MKKRLLFLLTYLFFCEFVKGSPIKDIWRHRTESLNITDCTWDKAEYWDKNSMSSYQKSFRTPMRFCVDKTNNTIFSFFKDKETKDLYSDRELGFLNKIETQYYGSSPKVYWKIENNNLVKYKCFTYGEVFPKCKGDLLKENFPKIK